MIPELLTKIANIDQDWIKETHALLHASPQIFFVGNGGSAAIASHMAIDWTKNGRVRSFALNDPSALSCLANDLGYEQVFSWQLERRVTPSSAVVCISSSGRSPNILNAARTAKELGGIVITLSGFDADNPLRRLGDTGLHIDSRDYGVVECAHLAALHAMVAP